VIGPTVLVAFLEHWLEHHEETASNLTIAVVVAVAAAVLGTLGGTFLAGLLDRMAGHHVHGHPFEGLGHTLRTLPYGRLLIADFVVSVVVLTASAFFVLPGLVVYTLLALVGPLIIIEELGVLSAVRRSVALVRTNFWLVFVSVTSVTVAEIAVEETLEHLGVADDLAGEIFVAFLVGVLAGSVAALIKVCATYELIAREIEGPAEPAGSN
jgi:hypothetical protein